MKQITFLVVLFALLYACNPAPPYQYIQSPTGQQMVVVRDDNGAEFLMEYMLFTSLMNSGGYNNVIHHYHTNTAVYPRYNRNAYGGWKSFNGRTYSSEQYNNYSGFRSNGNSKPATFKNTSPSGSPATFKNTTPSSSNSSWKSTSPRGSSSSSGFRSSSSSRSSSGSSGFRSSSSRSSSSSGFRSKKN